MSGIREIIAGTSTAAFRFFTFGTDVQGVVDALGGDTGRVESDYEVFAADPGSNLPGSPISAANYVITERGYGDYDIVFSVSTYFTTPGISSIMIRDTGSDEVIARLYYQVVASTAASLAALILTDTTRILGLLHENSLDDNHAYSSGKLTSVRKRVFASKIAANAATKGNANGVDSEIARYTLTFTYDGSGQLDSFKWVRDL